MNIDITSTAVEKGIDLVKGFVEKLVGSTLEETGLLMSDKIRLFRLKNQIKMLSKAQEICIQNNISIKQISLKTLVPLLEYSSLEEDNTLQEKWCNLLVNIVSEKERFESSVFPYILSQLSTNEVIELDDLFEKKINNPFIISLKNLNIQNLQRLGLIKIVTSLETVFYKDDFGNSFDYLQNEQNKNLNYVITELGEEFVISCKIKKLDNEKN
ncbi:Abi-alpha family protein [Flavobacterium terrigena]|uniref:DUF4393 domain-containing protein n=1 Tax=Flavobacterium terrigena TaxID=402734 RepID=A0A1H6UND4_9FLAO|nr:Abi-alpha family protein [Flavobacterium terrigena]SEI93788.1 hypothetical protein SAMN05660918_1978 [Flavobacterium terrigena]